MARINVAYLVSDNTVRPDKPRNAFLVNGQALLETFFAAPLGAYKIVYVNTFFEILTDLTNRARASNEPFGNVLIFAHGAPINGNRFAVLMPIEDQSEASQDQLNFLHYGIGRAIGRYNTIGIRDRIDLGAIGSHLDRDSTLAFMGCLFGKDSELLNTFRKLLGGNLTVLAPRYFLGIQFRTELNYAQGLMSRLDREGQQTLADRLHRVADLVDHPIARYLRKGYFPCPFLTEEKGTTKIYLNHQRAEHFGVSSPDQNVDPRAIEQRLRDIYPGWTVRRGGLDLPPARPTPAPTPPAPTRRGRFGGLWNRLFRGYDVYPRPVRNLQINPTPNIHRTLESARETARRAFEFNREAAHRDQERALQQHQQMLQAHRAAWLAMQQHAHASRTSASHRLHTAGAPIPAHGSHRHRSTATPPSHTFVGHRVSHPHKTGPNPFPGPPLPYRPLTLPQPPLPPKIYLPPQDLRHKRHHKHKLHARTHRPQLPIVGPRGPVA